MAYATLDDLKKEISEEELIQLTDDDGLGTVNQTVVDEICERASAEIDGYLVTRYNVPLDTPHILIKRICVDLVLYYLKLRRSVVTDDIQERKKNVDKLLNRISKGQVKLGVSEEPERVQTAEVKASTRSKYFNDDTWEAY